MLLFLSITGAGLASVVVAFFMSTYYNMIIAYAIFYFFSAFRSKLPWEDCSNRWNTKLCWPTHHGNMTKPAHSESPAEEFFMWVFNKNNSLFIPRQFRKTLMWTLYSINHNYFIYIIAYVSMPYAESASGM